MTFPIFRSTVKHKPTDPPQTPKSIVSRLTNKSLVRCPAEYFPRRPELFFPTRSPNGDIYGHPKTAKDVFSTHGLMTSQTAQGRSC